MAMAELTERLEDYLEAIYSISQEKTVARSRDIAARLDVHNSSVTNALQTLAERGLVNYAPYEFVTLTAEGEEAAREVLRKHEILSRFLTDVLRISADEAEINAHRMEHVVTDAALDRLVAFLEYVESCPREIAQWQDNEFACNPDPESESCKTCGKPIGKTRRKSP
jgi:DtxR family Mn-dependent transcriptional regulator